MSKYPDTRNKLDNNKPAKKKKPNTKNFKNLKETVSKNEDKNVPLKILKEKKPSKGSLFKKSHGYSKSMKRAMKKNHALSLEEYKPIRKAKKLKATKLRQEKHKKSVEFKRNNGKKGKGKQAVKAPATKK